jgi:hypothetical protein
MTQCQTVNTVGDIDRKFFDLLIWSESIKLQKPHQLQSVSMSEIEQDVPRKRTTEMRWIRYC